MSRFTMTLAASAAAAALAATAVVALPAIGDSGANTDQSPDVSGLAQCLAKHGLPGAPTTAATLKRWLADKEAQDPAALHAALDGCQASTPETGAAGPDAATLIACVRSHGFDPPTAPVDFKRWLGAQHEAGSKALDDIVKACNDTPQGSGGSKAKRHG